MLVTKLHLTPASSATYRLSELYYEGCFCRVYSDGGASYDGAAAAYGLALFGCI